MSHNSPEAYASKEQVFRLYDNLSAWMLRHCGLTWDDPSHNMGTYGNSGIPITSGNSPLRSFEVSPEAIRAHAPAMMQEFRLDAESTLFLYQLPEAYLAKTNDDWTVGSPLEESAFQHSAPQLNIACNLAATRLGRPTEQLVLARIEDEHCEVARQRRMIFEAGDSAAQEPFFSADGTGIISQAEMAALGKFTDMLYLHGPDTIRHTPTQA